MIGYKVRTDAPLVVRHDDGAVSLGIAAATMAGDDEVWLRFRTCAAYNAFREHLDREQAGHEQAAIIAYEAERDAYHKRVQALRTERADLIG